MNLTAVILAGGMSRRMGRDKAWVEFHGQTMIHRMLAIVRQAGIGTVLVSGRRDANYDSMGCPIVYDRFPGKGPLAGVETALSSVEGGLILVVAVDMPLMTSDFLRSLAQHCSEDCGCVPVIEGKPEPLAAIYPAQCHSISRKQIEQEVLSVRDFAEACQKEGLVKLIQVNAKDRGCFANLNSPDDMASYQEAKCDGI